MECTSLLLDAERVDVAVAHVPREEPVRVLAGDEDGEEREAEEEGEDSHGAATPRHLADRAAYLDAFLQQWKYGTMMGKEMRGTCEWDGCSRSYVGGVVSMRALLEASNGE